MEKNNFIKKLKGKVIVITGGSGYIGSRLVEILIKYDCRIIIVTRKKKYNNAKKIKYWKLNLEKITSWKKIIKSTDVVIHLFWNNSIVYAENNPKKSLFFSSIPITQMIRASDELSKKIRFIFTSTVTLYGLTSKNTIDENYIPSPTTYYDLNKLYVEKQLELASFNNIISSVSLRLANVYGPSPAKSIIKDRGLMNKAVEKAINIKKLNLYGGGKYLRDFVYIDDVVNAIIHSIFIKYSQPSTYNIGSGISYSIKKFFELIALELKKQTKYKIVISKVNWPNNSKPIDKRNFKCSIDLFKHKSNWKPHIKLKKGIRNLVINYLKN